MCTSVLAHGHAVVASYVAERVVLVDGPAETGVCRLGGDALLEGMREVHDLAAQQVGR